MPGRWLPLCLATLLTACASGEDPGPDPDPVTPPPPAHCPEWYPPDLGMEGVELRPPSGGARAIEVVGEGLLLDGVYSAVEVDGERYVDGEEVPGVGVFRAGWLHLGTSSLVEVRLWFEGDAPPDRAVRYLPVVARAGGGLSGIAAPVAMGDGAPVGEERAAALAPAGEPLTRAWEQLIGGVEGGLYLGPGDHGDTPLEIAAWRDGDEPVRVEVAQQGRAREPATAVLIGLGVDAEQVLQRAMSYVRYRTSAETCRPAPAGWESAPAYGWPLNGAVLDEGQAAVQGELGYLGADVGIAGGGWYDSLGDWGAGPALPEGVAGLGGSWDARGGQLGLWVAPLWAADESALAQEHPDALLRDEVGAFVPCVLAAAAETCAVVDATDPAGAARLHALGERLAGEHGARVLLLDHLGDGGGAGMRAGLAALRGAAPGVVLVAVDVPPWAVAGQVDAVRPGPYLDDATFLDCLVAEVDATGPRPAACDDLAAALTPEDAAATGSWEAVQLLGGRLAAAGHWNDALAALDPGPLVVAGLTPDEARTAATLTALAGGSYLLGDRVADLDGALVEIVTAPVLQDLRAAPGAVSVPDRLLRPGELPSLWWRELPGDEAALAVVNWGDEEAVIEVPLRGRAVRADLWNADGSWSSSDDGVVVTVPPHGVRLMEIR